MGHFFKCASSDDPTRILGSGSQSSMPVASGAPMDENGPNSYPFSTASGEKARACSESIEGMRGLPPVTALFSYQDILTLGRTSTRFIEMATA